MGAAQCTREADGVATLAAWHDERGNIADLAVHLIETDAIRPEQVGDVIEKPWKFGDSYAEMRAAEAQTELEDIGSDIAVLSRMALTPWPDNAA